jgi:hypothetical protein
LNVLVEGTGAFCTSSGCRLFCTSVHETSEAGVWV